MIYVTFKTAAVFAIPVARNGSLYYADGPLAEYRAKARISADQRLTLADFGPRRINSNLVQWYCLLL